VGVRDDEFRVDQTLLFETRCDSVDLACREIGDILSSKSITDRTVSDPEGTTIVLGRPEAIVCTNKSPLATFPEFGLAGVGGDLGTRRKVHGHSHDLARNDADHLIARCPK
jgi:hypothetical protein